jgi:hypothetical protein
MNNKIIWVNSLKKGIALLLLVVTFAINYSFQEKPSDVVIPISWFNNLKGDFSFAQEWSFAENVGMNDAQQIACIENCSEQIEAMTDRNGLIKSDSLDAYYKIVDSTRHYHTIESRCTIDGWKPTHFIKIRKYGDFAIEGHTVTDSNSKCSLCFRISNNQFTAWVYKKMDGGGTKIIRVNGGKLFLDELAFSKGIFKATFSFTFESEVNSFKALFWSGKIYARIES